MWRTLGDAIGLREGEGALTARLFGFVLTSMMAISNRQMINVVIVTNAASSMYQRPPP